MVRSTWSRCADLAGHDGRNTHDTNRDGVISKAEAAVAGRFAKHFDQLDANSDGMLTVAELTAAHAARTQQRMDLSLIHI